MRTIAASFALILAAGCAGGGPTVAPPAVHLEAGALYPAESPAARRILANVGNAATSRAPAATLSSTMR